MDTIFAVASGMQKAGVSVVRASGPAALLGYKHLTGRPVPPPRTAVFGSFRDKNQQLLDRGMAIYFPHPASFTGEDIVEYYLHGGVAVVRGFLQALSEQPEHRLAEPGEFTRRAFENGKMDLTAAEAVADLVNAETEAQKTQALDQLGGNLARLYEDWAEKLKKLLAHQEADIEFPDEDMPTDVASQLKPEIKNLLQEVKAHLDDKRRGERLRSGALIAILGAPNAGKSSLVNALTQRDVAIVSSEAGTTRDIIEAHLDLGGYPVIIADTAGLRDTESEIEKEGIRRARQRAAEADVKVVLFDGTFTAPDAETAKMVDEHALVVLTKGDCVQDKPKKMVAGKRAMWVSAQTGEGLEELLEKLTQVVSAIFTSRGGPTLTRQRHRDALEKTVAALERSLGANLPELAAEDLRLALRHLGAVTGKVHVEELLDTIFRDFCIGK